MLKVQNIKYRPLTSCMTNKRFSRLIPKNNHHADLRVLSDIDESSTWNRVRCGLWLWRPISLADSRIMSFRGADAGTGAMPVFLAFHRHRISLPASSSTCAKSPLRRLASLSGYTSDYRHVTITKFSLDFAISFVILVSPMNSKIQLVFTTQKKNKNATLSVLRLDGSNRRIWMRSRNVLRNTCSLILMFVFGNYSFWATDHYRIII